MPETSRSNHILSRLTRADFALLEPASQKSANQRGAARCWRALSPASDFSCWHKGQRPARCRIRGRQRRACQGSAGTFTRSSGAHAGGVRRGVHCHQSAARRRQPLVHQCPAGSCARPVACEAVARRCSRDASVVHALGAEQPGGEPRGAGHSVDGQRGRLRHEDRGPRADGNISIWLACDGFLNWSKHCNRQLDTHLSAARRTTDPALRLAQYAAAAGMYLEDRAHIFLYNYKWLWGVTEKVEGFAPHPDGIIRLQDVRFRP